MNVGFDVAQAALDLLRGAGGEPDATPGRLPLRIVGGAPAYDTPHRIVEACAAAIAANAIAVEQWWRHCGGAAQHIEIDLLQAAAGLYPVRYQRQNGYPMPLIPGAELAQDFFETADDRWFYPVASYPALRNRTLEILDCANTRPALARAIRKHTGDALEDLFALHRIPGACVRSRAQWLAHPQGQALSRNPTICIRRIADSAPVPPPATLPERPLSGLRVLDVSHVIAGPVVARTLAEQGAEALRISAPYQPDPLVQIMDTGIGKRAAFLDLRQEADTERLRRLCRDADVFIDSWRPGSLARRGFSAQDLTRMRPGIIHVSVSTYGSDGPWADRGGFEQIGQLVSGICHTEGRGGRPRLVPSHFLNDYLTGYLGAAGAAAALLLRSLHGGSYQVEVSLTGTSMWVQSLGEQPVPAQPVDPFAIQPVLESRDSPYGKLEQLPPIARFSRTPARWDLPPVPLGAHVAAWL
ncbi:MAG: CoA transferase [Burkholderiaceae bacterium]|nr:CoA transferase [Burkholderiaceae bacterium]MDO9088708.1 CoA transferase [Burkholderiaceae bacterium]